MRNSKCQHAVAELDGQGCKGALTVAYKIKMEYNMNPVIIILYYTKQQHTIMMTMINDINGHSKTEPA